MRTSLLFAALILSATAAQAQNFPPMQDPFAGVTGHYQTDAALPVQTQLEDCFLFEALAWFRGFEDVRTKMQMACRHIAFRRTSGVGLDDAEIATESLLLAFEDAARREMIRHDTVGVEAVGAIVLRTGWQGHQASQESIIADLGLDVVMELLFAGD
jgi:hypothetical protein